MHRRGMAVQLLQRHHLGRGPAKKPCSHLPPQRQNLLDRVQAWKRGELSVRGTRHVETINTIEHLRWIYDSNHACTAVTNLTAIEEDRICTFDCDREWVQLCRRKSQLKLKRCLLADMCALTVSVTKPE